MKKVLFFALAAAFLAACGEPKTVQEYKANPDKIYPKLKECKQEMYALLSSKNPDEKKLEVLDKQCAMAMTAKRELITKTRKALVKSHKDLGKLLKKCKMEEEKALGKHPKRGSFGFKSKAYEEYEMKMGSKDAIAWFECMEVKSAKAEVDEKNFAAAYKLALPKIEIQANYEAAKKECAKLGASPSYSYFDKSGAWNLTLRDDSKKGLSLSELAKCEAVRAVDAKRAAAEARKIANFKNAILQNYSKDPRNAFKDQVKCELGKASSWQEKLRCKLAYKNAKSIQANISKSRRFFYTTGGKAAFRATLKGCVKLGENFLGKNWISQYQTCFSSSTKPFCIKFNKFLRNVASLDYDMAVKCLAAFEVNKDVKFMK